MDELLSLINKSGLRQNHIAEKFDISPEYLSLILNGKRKANKMKDKIINYLKLYNYEIKNFEVSDASNISEPTKDYSVKDKIILSQAEEIFELKKILKDLSAKIDELEGIQEVMQKVVGSEEDMKGINKIK